jgi:hypothetical protein
MANRWRGEVPIEIDGTPRVMRLTLGALCTLEERLETGSIVELVRRFDTGEIRARDVLALLVAGLDGGGFAISEAELARSEIGGGPVAAVRAAAALLRLAFVLPDAPDGG